ncbi:MAG: aldo/keto reductase, partial [Christensenellaceae bacterium]|nr:aldo/keto reductase [Christensenellaceae bacterium]
MKTIDLGGLSLPVLGQGSWYMGDDPALEPSETAALRLGLEKGLTLVDTAEMYGSGRAESLIGRALEGIPRESYLLCSKVYPHNAGRAQIFKSCDASLKRLKTDFLDLYLLHWRGSIPLEETIECMEELARRGKIRRWGVSNFDLDDMQELLSIPGGERCAANQILYHLGSRGVEYDLLPYLRKNGIAAMAYCPLAQAGSLRRGLVLNP